jgi:hypothetical protein
MTKKKKKKLVGERREISACVSILGVVAENEAKGNPTAFFLENLAGRDESEIDKEIAYYVPMLVDNGFLRKIADQADFDGLVHYHITWKGHCLIDLFERYGDWDNYPEGSPIQVAAEIAVLSLH